MARRGQKFCRPTSPLCPRWDEGWLSPRHGSLGLSPVSLLAQSGHPCDIWGHTCRTETRGWTVRGHTWHMGDMQSHTKGTYVSPKLGAALCPQSAPQLPPHRIPQWTPSPQCPHSPSRDHWGRGAGPHPNAAHGAAVPRCPSTATITPRPQHVPIAPTPPSPTPAPRRDPHGLSPLPVAGLSAACPAMPPPHTRQRR